MKWIKRNNIHNYELDELFDASDKIIIFDVSSVSITIGDTISNGFDIGSWLYSTRKNIATDGTVLIHTESYREKRKKFIVNVLKFLYSKKRLGKRDRTIINNLRSLNAFVKWCDINQIEALDNISSSDKSEKIILKYTYHISERIASGSIKPDHNYQLPIIGFYRFIFEDFYRQLFQNIPCIGRQSKIYGTEQPINIEQLLNTYNNVFNQITDCILKFEKLPLKINLKNKNYWIFPYWSGRIPCGFCKETGKIRKIKEIMKVSNLRKYDAKKAKNRAVQDIYIINHKKYSSERMRIANLAARNFVMLFIANTGMSLSQVCDLPWIDGQYEEEGIGILFKSIKYRANNKPVEFIIGIKFIQQFRKYLELRNYILKGSCKKYDKLFFTYSFKYKSIKNYSELDTTYLNHSLNTIFNINTVATTRQLRAFKNNAIQNITHDTYLTSMVMQHSEQTSKKYYHNATKEQQAEELNNFFIDLNDVLIPANISTTDVTHGQCKSIDHPKYKKKPYIKPDCKNRDGCLFCENFAIHADIKGYKKLLSATVVINTTQILTSNIHHHKRYFRPVLDRLNTFIQAIENTGNISNKEIEKAKRKILEEGNVSKPWRNTIELIYDIAQ